MQIERALLAWSLAAVLTFWSGTIVRSATPTFAVVGGVGFNWLEPATAQCVRITETSHQRLKHCEFHSSGAFGLPLAYHACKVANGGEMLVFEDASKCQEALETMQANAP